MQKPIFSVTGWMLFLVTGLVLFLAGFVHPWPPDEITGFDDAMSWMLSKPSWRIGHLPALVAAVLIGASVMWLARRARGVPAALLLRAGIGSVLAICEMIVHVFVDADAVAFSRGRDAPLVDLHLFLQAAYTPILGTAFATLAIWGAGGRRLSHPIIAALGAVSALAWGLAGPAVAVYRSTELAALFAGVQGLAIWFIATGVTQVMRERRSAAAPEHPTRAVAT